MLATLNIHEAKTHLSRYIDLAVNGQPFIIARAGKPLVRVEAIAPTQKVSRVGGLSHLGLATPTLAQWNAMDAEIDSMFNGA
jgi:prevent-host-death family protein